MPYSKIGLGLNGFQRITDADGVQTGNWAAVLAVNGDVTFGPGCAVHSGEPPADGDTLTVENYRLAPFSAIEVSSGVVYAYHTQRT